ncbi:MAG: hypothetical protein CMH25_06080 [Micavibrio sp.]|nr:hypothetical protein [Micavibrio sp.]|tara:strand:- start:93748 stop:94764 length:1017 start_codon:yes stop_codon:yes gene_type:complete
MALIQLWDQNPDIILKYNIKQIVSSAGDGVLKDNSECAKELKHFLSNAPTEKLFEHIEFCISNSFDKSGYVLQDIINELGSRLDYEVESGLYQGRSGQIGFDGIWESPNGHAIVLEIKTTDAYRINLDTVAQYRNKLIESGRISKNSSILIVVGRNDTGDLEAQIRGSRHAWDVRIISTEALIKLLELKIKSDEDETTEKIRNLLIPFEYTRLDNIIDVIFTTAKDVENADDEEQAVKTANAAYVQSESVQNHTPREILERVRLKALEALGKRQETTFIAHKRSQFWSADKSTRVVCPVSKKYETGHYWYAFHPRQQKFLEEGNNSFFMLGCLDSNYA